MIAQIKNGLYGQHSIPILTTNTRQPYLRPTLDIYHYDQHSIPIYLCLRPTLDIYHYDQHSIHIYPCLREILYTHTYEQHFIPLGYLRPNLETHPCDQTPIPCPQLLTKPSIKPHYTSFSPEQLPLEKPIKGANDSTIPGCIPFQRVIYNPQITHTHPPTYHHHHNYPLFLPPVTPSPNRSMFNLHTPRVCCLTKKKMRNDSSPSVQKPRASRRNTNQPTTEKDNPFVSLD